MRPTILKTSMLMLIMGLLSMSASAQGSLIRRIQDRTEQKVVDEIFRDNRQQNQNQDTGNTNNPGEQQGTNGTQNRRGTGLNQQAPDVLASINEASTAMNSKNYIQAKTAVRNALWGVELEVGKKVLESLPTSVSGLNHVQAEDRVSSAGANFIGLMIERMYRGNQDREVKATIGNDSALLGLAGYYMLDGRYMQSTDETNQKQVQYQGQRANIRYTDSEGYTLSVPFGQSSVFVITGVNFDNETQFMQAANTFNIETIKKGLGEQ